VTQHFSPNPETTSNLFETYDTVASAVFKPTIDNEDNAETVISNHLHSVKSLKKFFETKMVVQRPMPVNDLPMNPAVDEQKSTMKTTDQLEQRQEMMNQVLESLKQTKAYSRLSTGKNPSCPFNSIANFSHLETPESNGRCSAMTTSSYESNLAQNLPVQRHYSRRFRSSSTSYTSFSSNGNIITHIHPSKRAFSQDRQYYQTTNHHLPNLDQWKRDRQDHPSDDDDDNMSENSMLWQAKTKLNQFVNRTKRNQQLISEDFYNYDDTESVTAETRF